MEVERVDDGDNIWLSAFTIAIWRTMDRFETMSAFVAVAERRGFAAAARALGTSPPVITRAVAALERHLGVTLFQRSTRAVSLTDEGAAFLDRARQILADLREAEQILRGGRSVPRGQLYVTAPVMSSNRGLLVKDGSHEPLLAWPDRARSNLFA
jgi:DNA-binding transcriptional LysR family regulator